MKKLFILADKIEAKLKKMADAQTEQRVVKEVLDQVYNKFKNNPALSGTIGISPYVDVQKPIGSGIPEVVVTFQVIADQKSYDALINDPAKSNLVNFLKPIVETNLAPKFNHFNVRTNIGIVI